MDQAKMTIGGREIEVFRVASPGGSVEGLRRHIAEIVDAASEVGELGSAALRQAAKGITYSFTCEVDAGTWEGIAAALGALGVAARREVTIVQAGRRTGPRSRRRAERRWTVPADAVEVKVDVTRRGRKRPGQWTDRTRAKRRRRIVKADRRRDREFNLRRAAARGHGPARSWLGMRSPW